MRSKLLITALLSLGIFTALCVHYSRRTQLAERTLLTLEQQRRTLTPELSPAAKEELAHIERELPKIQRATAVLRIVTFIDGTAPVPAAEAAEKETASIAEQEQRARAYRGQLSAQYLPFYYKAKLSPAQIDRLETILTDYWHATEDISAVAKKQGLTSEDPAISESQIAAVRALFEAKDALLGEEVGKQFYDYERSLPARTLVGSVAEHLYYTATPMTGAQAEQLTQLLADHSPDYKNGSYVNLDTINWAAALPQAQAMLSPLHFAALKDAHAANVLLPENLNAFGKKLASILKDPAKPTPTP